MNNRTDWLAMTMRGGQIRRFHAFPIIGQENVAEHSFGVAMVVLAMTDWKASPALLKAALYHDISEQHTGDIPFTAKRDNPILKAAADAAEEWFNEQNNLDIQLPPRDWLVLKWADMLHLLLFCKAQRDLGNRGMNQVFANGVEFLSGLENVPEGQEILNWIIETYGG